MTTDSIVTVVTGILQTGGVGIFVFYLIKGLRDRISSLNATVEEQNKTLEVMEKRIIETEKIGGLYKTLISDLPQDLDNYKAIISKTKDETIVELQNQNQRKDLKIQELESATRKEMESPSKQNKKQLAIVRFLVQKEHEDFRKFIEDFCGSIDTAVPILQQSIAFADIISSLGGQLSFEDDRDKFELEVKKEKEKQGVRTAYWDISGHYAVFTNYRVLINNRKFQVFDSAVQGLRHQLDEIERTNQT